jgi:hypothetical protein
MSEINYSLPPREFIAAVRESYNINDSRAERSNRQLNKALEILSVELYSDDTHFLLELIQNADDNKYGVDVVPRLLFELKPDRLVVVNNENGFSAKDVDSLCSLGDSTKAGDRTKTGEKGIGFKSVFSVSDAPEIHSNGFHFRFDRTKGSNLLGFIVPTWIEVGSDAVDGQTAIVLPARPNNRFDLDRLHGLDPNLLLFLRQLRQIGVNELGTFKSFERVDRDGLSVLRHLRQRPGEKQTIEQNQYLTTEFSVGMESVVEEKRPDINQTDIVLAFPVSESYVARPDIEGSKLYAFLPVLQAGFRFSIQADFVLSASRGAIRENLAWNIRLRDAIADAFVGSLEAFKKHEALGNSYLDFIPHKGEVRGDFLGPVRRAIFEQLIRTNCILSASGVWSLPANLRVAPKRFRELFPSNVVKLLFGYDYIHLKLNLDAEVISELRIQGALLADVVSVFNSHLTWFREQSREWQSSLYAYIADSHEQYIKAGLLSAPFLPLEDGTLVAPKGQEVYFPLGKRKKYGFEGDLSILDVELFSLDKEHSPKIDEFLKAVGVLTDDPYNMIVGHIIPKHVSGNWQSVSNESLLGHLRYIKEKCADYLAGAARNMQSEADAFKLLSDKLYIGTKHHHKGDWGFGKAEDLYIGDAYLPEFPIEKHLEGVLGASSFVSEDYLPKKSKNETEVAASWRIFLAHLGITDTPRVTPVLRDWHCTKELLSLLKSSELKVRSETLLCVSRNWHLYADKVGMQPAGSAFRGQVFRIDSTFIKALRATVVSTNRKVPVILSQTYYPSTEIQAMMGSSVTYVDAGIRTQMLDACQVSYTLDAKVLIKRLRQFKVDDSGETAKAIQKIYGRIEDIFDEEKGLVLKAFTDYSLIRVKGPHKSWRRPDEVCWESSGAFLDSICPPLEGQYKDFSEFFRKLGVRKEIPIEKRIDALEELGGVDSMEERRKVALSCYERFSRMLKKGSNAEESLPSWMQHFSTRALFLDRDGRMVEKDNDLFVDDMPNISRHFADATDISFLAAPQTALAGLQRFLQAADVPYLSESYASELISGDDVELDEGLTLKVRQFAPYFAQILHERDHDAYEGALENGALKALRALDICVADEVQLSVSLAGVDRTVSVDIARNERRIVYKRGARTLDDKIAAQLRVHLGTESALEEMFARILIYGDVAHIEEYLEEKQIAQLPEGSLFCDEVESEGEGIPVDGEVTSVEDAPDEVAPQENPSEELQESAELDVEPAATGKSESALQRGSPTPKVASTSPGDVKPDSQPPNPGAEARAKREVASPIADVVQRPEQFEEDKDGPKPSGQSNANSQGGRSDGPSAPGIEDRLQPAPYSGNAAGKGANDDMPDGKASTAQPQEGATKPLGGSPGHQFSGRPGGAGNSLGKRKSGTSGKHGTRTGHLMSYVLLKEDGSDDEDREVNSEAALEKRRTGSIAVKFFMENQAARWTSLTEMPELNPGYDVLAVAHDGEEEFIEVKGQTDVWTERGVTLTPRELVEAQKRRGRYWLCVVEYVHDEKRRRLYLFQDPFGLTDQFKFDSGWKAAAIAVNDAPLLPEVGRYIEIPGEGRGKIISVTHRGKLSHLHVLLDTGKQKNLLFKPDKMTVSEQ